MGSTGPNSPSSQPSSADNRADADFTLLRAMHVLCKADEETGISTACNNVEEALYRGAPPTPEEFEALCKPLATALHTTSGDALLTCVETARTLCSRPLHCVRASAALLVPALLSTLCIERGTDAQLQLGALSALRHLCAHDEHRAILASDDTHCRSVVRIMLSFEQLPSAQTAALCALFGPSHATCIVLPTEEAHSITAAGGARAALRAARVHARRAGVVAAALRALGRVGLSASDTARGVLRASGAVRVALDALMRHEKERDVAAGALGALAALDSACALGAIAPRVVLAAMCSFRGEVDVHRPALQVLCGIAGLDKTRALAVAKIGASQVVLTSMIQYREDALVQGWCVKLLTRLLKVAGKESMEVSSDDVRRTISGSIRVHIMNAELMEGAAELVKLFRD